MRKHLILFLTLAFFLSFCSPVVISPTPSPTVVVLPTRTFALPPLATPTLTPYPALQTQGPYLLFTWDNQNLTLLDPHGMGRKQIELPGDGYLFVLDKSLSPDGRWIAYFTGSHREPYDAALHLLNLSDETTRPVSTLLASNFPENLAPIIDDMVLGDPPRYDNNCFQDRECRRSLVQRELANSIFSFDWSPDSQSIAFAAQIDDPSSDIYIYNIQAETIHRLTAEPENIYWLDWAPNGKKILYEISSTPGMAYEGRTLHMTDLKGKTTFVNADSLYHQRWGEVDWFTESMYLLEHPNDTDKPPIYDLMIVDTETGQLKELWPYSLELFAMNKENNTIVLIHKNHQTQLPTVQEGIYMVYPSGKYRKIGDIEIQLILRQGQGPYPIFSQDYNGQIYSIDSNGSMTMLPWSTDKFPWISPDGSLFLFEEEKKLALYNNAYQPIKSWQMEEDFYSLTWRPDSLGVFIFTENNVYSLAVSDEQPRIIEYCPLERCENVHFAWLP